MVSWNNIKIPTKIIASHMGWCDDTKSNYYNKEIKINKNTVHKTILFSPSAASFDNFKNFEKRGEYFNQLIKKYINV